MLFLIRFLVMSLFFVTPYALAQDGTFGSMPKGGLSLGGRAAYYNPNDANGNFFGGAQLRLHMSPAIGLEGSVDYRRTKFSQTRIDTFPVQVSLLAYLFPGVHISPFALGGAGWYFTHIKGPGGFDDTQQRFGVHVGGGLQIFLNEDWSIDGTYRFIWLEKVESKDSNLLDKKFDDSGPLVTVALNFHFP